MVSWILPSEKKAFSLVYDEALGFDPRTNATSGALASVQDSKVMICESGLRAFDYVD